MADIQLSVQTNDLVFDGEEFLLTKTTDETLAQRLRIKLKTFLGEWAFNIEAGVPWFQEILGKKGSKSKADSIIRQQVLDTPGVDEILDFQSVLNTSSREYAITSLVIKDADGGSVEVNI